MLIRLTLTLMLIAGTVCISVSHAGVIPFAPVSGTNVTFSDIVEFNGSPPLPSLYAGLSVSGNTLVFGSELFAVNAASPNFTPPGLGFDVVDSRISFTATADPGTLITSVVVRERGLSFTEGSGSQTNVNAGGFVTVGGTMLPSVSDTFSEVNAGPTPTPWSLTLTFPVVPTNQVKFDFDNALFAALGNGTTAAIQKDEVAFEVITTTAAGQVPEPTSAMIFAGTLGWLLSLRRRRCAS